LQYKINISTAIVEVYHFT